MILDGQFSTDRRGRPASSHLTYERVWSRYLDVFSSLVVVARQFPEEQFGASPIEGPGVTFVGLPPIRGLRQVPALRRLSRGLAASIEKSGSACIVRMPSAAGFAVARRLGRSRRPYAVEVVSDPYTAFAKGTVSHPLRPVLRSALTMQLQRSVARASAVQYVAEALVERYPPERAQTVAVVSDVSLAENDFVQTERTAFNLGSLSICFVGSLQHLYKAPDLLIEAVGLCVKDGLDLRLRIVGDGRFSEHLRTLAARENISDKTEFLGWLPGPTAVRQVLDESDVFVLPSRTEGLPRVLLEAMARALPCLGSEVGGIPELLRREDLIPELTPAALASRLTSLASDSGHLAEMSQRNLLKAREYSDSHLQPRRRAFYDSVKQLAPVAL